MGTKNYPRLRDISWPPMLKVSVVRTFAIFYMTKYLAKGQQVLASAVTPVIQGLQRLEDEIAAGTKQLTSLEDAARAKLRRILFSANRSHWFSACELAIFVLTGGHSIATHIDRPMFLSRVFFMLEEGKRLRNGALRGQFLHEAAQALEGRSSEVAVVEVVLQPQETEHVAVDDAAPKRQRLEECLSEKSVEEPAARVPPDSGGSNEGPAEEAPRMQMFHATASILTMTGFIAAFFSKTWIFIVMWHMWKWYRGPAVNSVCALCLMSTTLKARHTGSAWPNALLFHVWSVPLVLVLMWTKEKKMHATSWRYLV